MSQTGGFHSPRYRYNIYKVTAHGRALKTEDILSYGIVGGLVGGTPASARPPRALWCPASRTTRARPPPRSCVGTQSRASFAAPNCSPPPAPPAPAPPAPSPPTPPRPAYRPWSRTGRAPRPPPQ
eukprot:1138960-Prorocentrum_minimum.AAC.1